MSSAPLTFKNDQWITGCGCGGVKPTDIVTPPAGSRAVLIQHTGLQTGPVTGLQYNVIGAYVSIDIAWEDATRWLETGFAIEPRQGLKGILTRVETQPTEPTT